MQINAQKELDTICQGKCDIIAPKRHRYLYGPRCDPAVVKVDERKKLCLTTVRLIFYCHLLVDAGTKKESMESKTTASARQREATYPDEKNEKADSYLAFFPGFQLYF